MRRQIPGLHSNQRGVEDKLEGLFLGRVDRAPYLWHPQKPFVEIRFVILESKPFETRLFSGRLYCTERALWKLNQFLRDFAPRERALRESRGGGVPWQRVGRSSRLGAGSSEDRAIQT